LRDAVPAKQLRLAALAILRSTVTIVVLVALYYVLPLDHLSDTWSVVLLAAGLVGVTILVAWQIIQILRSDYPGIRGVEALALSVPLFLLIFAATYYLIAHSSPSNFSQPLTRTDALYFTVTTFATVGFGDITATSEGTRLLVTFQMIADLIVIGFGVKVVFGAVQRGRQRPERGDQPREPLPGGAGSGGQ
jgi:voltage-gated potassium channel